MYLCIYKENCAECSEEGAKEVIPPFINPVQADHQPKVGGTILLLSSANNTSENEYKLAIFK